MAGDAKRILVYGVTGSGKTTLARRLSEITGIPWHSVDDLAWLPNWQAVPHEEQVRRVTEICAGEEWILDTAYANWIGIPMARVQMIVALDYSRLFTLFRLILRTMKRVVDKKPVCNGNYETWRGVLSRDSIIGWHFKSFGRKRRRLRQWLRELDRVKVIILRRHRDTERWLRGLASGTATREEALPSGSPPPDTTAGPGSRSDLQVRAGRRGRSCL